ncbi:hypothetical protein [Lysinibacillus xylanilyticus]|uniref:hypothetical protein n=1 Tax=Lysinibacillus xylanilyticus TaxID=582475 RepID=UPI003D092B26
MKKSFCLKEKFLLFLCLSFVVLSGCVTNGNPTPKDFLKDGKADIFVLDDIVYSNVENIDWVKELDYTIDEKIGVITKQTNKSKGFVNGTSNKLPVGTIIYKTDTPINIAIVDGKEIPYLKMIEG